MGHAKNCYSFFAILLLLTSSVHSHSHAFATLLASDDYLPGTLALIHSVAEQRLDIPFYVVMIQGEVSFDSAGVLVQYQYTYPHLELLIRWTAGFQRNTSACHISAPAHFENTFSKLDVFSPSLYGPNVTRVVYLDSDTLVVNSCVQELFSTRRYRTPAFASEVYGSDAFNTGVFVISPSSQTHADLMSFARSGDDCSQADASYDGGDQGLLNAYYASEWSGVHGLYEGWSARHRLAFRYNAMLQAALYNPKEWGRYEKATICVVHFAGPAQKPFNQNIPKLAIKQISGSPVVRTYHTLWHKVYGSIAIPSKPAIVPLF